jgi:hypothetical protein
MHKGERLMAGFSDYVSQAVLNHIVGKTPIFTLPQAFIALFTAVGSDSGSGFTEVIGGGYARVATAATDWNAASGSSPTTISNAHAIIFPAVTTAWNNIIGFGMYDASGGGNLLAWDYFGNFAWKPTTVTAASPATFTQPAHGYLLGDRVVFTIEYGGLMPGGAALTGLLTIQATTADTFTVGLNTTTSGEGMVRKVLSQTIQVGIQPLFAAGSLSIANS